MKLLPLTAAMILCAGYAAADPASVAETAKGPTLVDSNGMTLYTFAKDSDGKSACVDKCAANWPPLMAGEEEAVMGDWGMLQRDDGTMQWSYKGQPLYTFAKDGAPGDVTGDGLLEGAWQVAQP